MVFALRVEGRDRTKIWKMARFNGTTRSSSFKPCEIRCPLYTREAQHGRLKLARAMHAKKFA